MYREVQINIIKVEKQRQSLIVFPTSLSYIWLMSAQNKCSNTWKELVLYAKQMRKLQVPKSQKHDCILKSML
jgi:hypothetical protein